VALYDQLYALRPDDVVWLNRAVAVAELDGPQAGLDALTTVQLDAYHLLHATRAELHARLGRWDDARAAYDRALELVTNETERRFLRERRAALDRR
jgi:RNA polymerase sigma-70 factor (ECF subfamily)